MNILTIANLLQEFVTTEVPMLNEQDIKHPTSIGTMYEGLTEAILNKTIFEGLNLKVIKNSFILGCDTEFDVMLVEGEGEQLPYSDRYKYKPEQVIAIIQVKKNLYGDDLENGYNNLRFLIDYFEDRKLEQYMIRLFRDGFRAACRKDITSFKSGDLSENEKLIFNTLKVEASLPVRIIWGYNGFKDEFNFRESFQEYLKTNLTTNVKDIIGGFGPHNFPNLIICGHLSMIKLNGMPFGSPVLQDGWWPFYATSSYNPTHFLLEALWTRLSYRFENLPMEIFGEDLTVEPVKRFLDAKLQDLEEQKGWAYNYHASSRKSLKEHSSVADWQPVAIDDKQYVIINEIGQKGFIDLSTDDTLESYVIEDGTYTSLQNFLVQLLKTGLVFIEENKLKLLTDQCECVCVNGQWFAGENKSGRLTNWGVKEIKKLKSGKP